MNSVSETVKMQRSAVKEGVSLPIMEAFSTIQGEGCHSGKAAFFIRTAGCDVGCVWCDVKDSWEAAVHPVLEVEKIVQQATANPARIAVITGGEPLMYNMLPITSALKNKGFSVHLETSGANPYSGNFDWVCLSPKKFKKPLPDIYPLANELKIIVFNKHDLVWAEEEAQKAGSNCRLLLQPEWSKRHEVMPLITSFLKSNPRWQVSLQTHKYMNIP